MYIYIYMMHIPQCICTLFTYTCRHVRAHVCMSCCCLQYAGILSQIHAMPIAIAMHPSMAVAMTTWPHIMGPTGTGSGPLGPRPLTLPINGPRQGA